ncbi:26685_t:CDS:2, partial [Racocetra persica]
MQDTNRHILLLIDGATSHAVGDVDLTNIKVVTLPPRTTSKLQLIDAGIIAAFKYRYYHFLLQHAIDHDEAKESDIYKCIRAWYSIPPKTITNCFRHTGLFDYKITASTHEVYPNDEDSSVLAELEESLKTINDPENNNDADDINDSSSSFTTPSNSVKLDAIRTVISLLNTTISDHNAVLRTLRSLQRDIQLQVSSSKVQATLDSFMQVGYQNLYAIARINEEKKLELLSYIAFDLQLIHSNDIIHCDITLLFIKTFAITWPPCTEEVINKNILNVAAILCTEE